MVSIENNLEKLPDTEFKRMTVNMVKPLKEYKDKAMNEIRRSIPNRKIDFESMKKTQALRMLEMKNSVSQLKISVESLTNTIEHFKNRKSEVLDESEELNT